MSVKNPKRIVVDTSISREFLLGILTVCHRVAMTQDLNREWKKHHTNFSIEWQTWMARRGKVKKVSNVRDKELRDTIYHAAPTPKKLEAMEKDVLLLEATLTTDHIIASLDEKVRTLFGELAEEHEALRTIVWINPVNEEEHPLEWLKIGAKPEKERQLGYNRKE